MASKPSATPRWAETAGGTPASNIATPTSGEADTGYAASQASVSSSKLNYLLHLLYLWVLYIRDAIFVATAASGLAGVSATGDGAGAGGTFTGGATGPGGTFTGGATSGAGLAASATAGNSPGGTFAGHGTSAGASFTGGATGPGISPVAGGGSSPTRGAIALGVPGATPSAPQNGDLWADLASGHTLSIILNGAARVIQANARVLPTYGVTVSIDTTLGTEFVIQATNGTAFTISGPLAGNQGKRITVRVVNSSGGALGAITWGGAYKMSAWTNPANGFNRSIDFQYNDTTTVWVEVSRTPADVPN